MNQINMRKKSLCEYKAVIFDLDGTLYFQKPFRVRMLTYLIGYVITHPLSVKDMFIIKKYRQVREEWEKFASDDRENDKNLNESQYAFVAEKMKVKPERVKKAVSFFMLETPLKFLQKYKDSALAEIINKLHKQKITVVIYSDYPVEDKLNALGINADACYTSADERIGCMKPNPKGIGIILKDFGYSPEDVIMIGDRYEKDGLAAKENDVDYIILSNFFMKRLRAYTAITDGMYNTR